MDMLELALQKLKGIDRWPETNATVTSYEVVSDGGYKQGPPSARIAFFYRDDGDSLQSGELIVDSLTSLYNIGVNDTFPLRFNPKQPSRFYCSEATSLFTASRHWFWFFLGLVLAVLIILVSK